MNELLATLKDILQPTPPPIPQTPSQDDLCHYRALEQAYEQEHAQQMHEEANRHHDEDRVRHGYPHSLFY